ncbi:MAG TPA: hypothetical protein VK174_18550, partial [Chitinophagales bacterium]|nr:hypothetical protein [Chitinophagales bacterium]
MKHFYLTAILLLLFTQLHAQVANDDCQTANDAGIMDGTPTFNAYNGALYDTCIVISNTGATTSFPYLYTSATCGSYQANSINTDVWVKFASYNMFSITGMTPIGNTSFDSVSITFWVGAECSSMQAIGNFQYSLNTMGFFYDTIRVNSFAI